MKPDLQLFFFLFFLSTNFIQLDHNFCSLPYWAFAVGFGALLVLSSDPSSSDSFEGTHPQKCGTGPLLAIAFVTAKCKLCLKLFSHGLLICSLLQQRCPIVHRNAGQLLLIQGQLIKCTAESLCNVVRCLILGHKHCFEATWDKSPVCGQMMHS